MEDNWIFYLVLVSLLVLSGSRNGIEADVISLEDRVLSQVDESHAACDDLYRHSCGKATKSTWLLAQEQFDRRSQELLENEQLYVAGQEGSDHLSQLRKLYKSCKATSRSDTSGRGTLQLVRLIDRLGGFPMSRGQDEATGRSLVDIMTNFRLEGIDTNGLFRFEVKRHPEDHTKDTLFHLSAKESLLSRKHLKGPLLQHFVPILYELGITDEELDRARAALPEVEKFVEALEDARRPAQEPETSWYETTLGEIRSEKLNWVQLLEAISHQSLSDDTPIIVWHSLDLESLKWLMDSTKPEVVENYLFLLMIEQLGSKISSPINAMVRIEPLACLDTVRQYLDPLFINTFVRAHENEMMKLQRLASEMFETLRWQLTNLIHLPWVYTNQRLCYLIGHKLSSMRLIPGFHQEHLNETLISELYGTLELSSTDLLGNLLQIRRLTTSHEFNHRYRKPVWPLAWLGIAGNPSHVNAIYSPEYNTINVNLGLISSGVHLALDAKPELNFGLLGSIMGHEMSHSLDPYSIQFDEFGNLKGAGQVEKLAVYEDKFECIRKQYDGILISGTTIRLNGTRTLNENFCDIMGYYSSQGALLEWFIQKELLRPMDKRLFWLAAASVWCEDPLISNWDIASQARDDPHSPNEFRVNVAVSNVDQFGIALECPQEGAMMRPDKCKFWQYQ